MVQMKEQQNMKNMKQKMRGRIVPFGAQAGKVDEIKLKLMPIKHLIFTTWPERLVAKLRNRLLNPGRRARRFIQVPGTDGCQSNPISLTHRTCSLPEPQHLPQNRHTVYQHMPSPLAWRKMTEPSPMENTLKRCPNPPGATAGGGTWWLGRIWTCNKFIRAEG